MPLVFEQHKKEESHLLIWKDNESIAFFRSRILLSPKEEERLDQYNVERRKKDFLIARFLLQRLIPEAEISYHPNGKPYLSKGDHFISISHSKDLVAIYIHRDKTVGIDIEYISPRVEKLKERFLSQEEIQEANTLEKLTLMWSAKECLFKIDEKQGIDFKNDLAISVKDETHLQGLIRKDTTYNINYRSFEEWVLCYASI